MGDELMGKSEETASTFTAATQEILKIISESRDDELPVFDAILKNACRLCDATRAALMLVNPERTHSELKHRIGYESRYSDVRDRWPLDAPYAQTEAIRTGAVIHIEDLKDTDLYRDGDKFRIELVDKVGLRTSLAVPLLQDGVAIGVIVVLRHDKPRAFSDDEIQMTRSFAAQAVIAIENVHQFGELQIRLEREEATREILQVISQSRTDEKPVFDVILENALRLCKAPLGFLSVLNDSRTHVSIPAHRGVRSSFATMLDEYWEPLEGSPLVANLVISQAKTIMSDELGIDQRYPAQHLRRSQLVDVEGARSLLAVPLISDGEAIGGIVLYRREVAPFGADDVALVRGFADQAVIAIENVKQFRALQERTEEVHALNENLESRVEEQVGEIERMGRLKRFLPAAVADVVVTTGDEGLLSSHRAMIATLFCDLRGFTAFCEAAEPEETIEVLQTYHHEMSTLIDQHGGGVDQRAGDGIMVIFNDPLPCDDPAGSAVRLAIAMREKMRALCAQWKKLGHRLGFGVGISLGYATFGMVGSAGRLDYTASGTSVNTAARLCDLAKNDEILLSTRAWTAVEDDFHAECQGEVEMKGIREPVEVFSLTGSE